MNVRKISSTTFSLILLIVGLCFFIPKILHILPYEVWHIIDRRFSSQQYIGIHHSFILTFSVWLIVVVGAIDAIFQNRVMLKLLFSFNVPVVLGIPIMLFVFIPSINDYLFWGLFYFTLIFGIYWTFRKFISNNYPGGQKLILFIKNIKTGTATGDNHILDRYTVFGISILLIVVYTLLLVSFVVYVVTYWRMFT